MVKLIRFELRKLMQQKSFYICMAMSLLFLSINFTVSQKLSTFMNVQSLTGLDAIQSTIGSLSYTLILSICIALFITDDYAGGTIKNIFSKGYSRTQVFFAKYIVSLFGTLLFTLVCTLFSFAIGSFLGGVGNIGPRFLLTMICQILLLTAYHTMYFGFSIVLGKSGSAIAGCIIMPTVFTLLYSLFDSWISFSNFTFKSIWLDNLLGNLSKAPVNSTLLRQSALFSLIYIILFGTIALILSQKKEY
ncbi:MAG: ABC transporter permease [bacterium]|nr:ABC transporter permease [bacterium]